MPRYFKKIKNTTLPVLGPMMVKPGEKSRSLKDVMPYNVQRTNVLYIRHANSI
jgi:hypothetical protein